MRPYPAGHPGVIGREELARGAAVPMSMLPGVAKPLRRAGILTTKRGNQGGFALARAPTHITMGDIVGAMEQTTRINRCLERDCHCLLGCAATCSVRAFYAQVQAWVDAAFADRTIASFLAPAEPEKREKRKETRE